MDTAEFKNEMANWKWKYYLAVVFALLLLGGNVAMSVAVYRQRNNHTEITIPAGGITEKYVFVNGRMPPEYLRRMVHDAAMLDMHYHHTFARMQFGELAAMFDPSLIKVAQQKYTQRAEQIEKGEMVSNFHIDRMTVRKETPDAIDVEVKGTRTLEGKGMEREASSPTLVVKVAARTPFRVMDITMEGTDK